MKKRLIGAAILIVIAAIVLPMFLGDRQENRHDSQTLSLDIPPAPDRDMSQVTLPLGTPQPADPDRVASVDTATAPRPGTAAGVDEPNSPAPATNPPTPVPGTPAEPTPAPTASDPPASTTPVPSPAPAPSTAPTPSAPAVPTTADGNFWVNLGSYGQAANADRVAAAARNRGIEIERGNVTTGGRSLIRLRAGPYGTRAQAEQARQLLIAAVPDARPKVESSGDAPTADAPAAATTAGAGAWAVQVGAFDKEANARQLSDRLKAAGFPAFVERRGENFAVRVGPYVRRGDADTQRQRLKSDQRLDGMIVSHSR